MGPNTLFDKSFIQSLSVDDSVWFDAFYSGVICPIYFSEVLADLAKPTPSNGRDPLADVRGLAHKSPEMHGAMCAHHDSIAHSVLHGFSMPMTGQIPVPHGRPVRVGDQRGISFDEAPETLALRRWQDRKFEELEREHAAQWRARLASLDLASLAAPLRSRGVDGRSIRSLADARDLAHQITTDRRSPVLMVSAAAEAFCATQQERDAVQRRWHACGGPPLHEFAPYTAHVLEIELFFQLALASDHISTERPSNRMDIAYLYYLPFCNLFVSGDKLHAKCAPLFLRRDQQFVWGPDLKADLVALNQHFSTALDDATKALGIMRFCSAPPDGEHFLTRRLWNSVFGSGAPRYRVESTAPERNEKLASHNRQFADAPTMGDIDFDPADADAITIPRRIHAKKGSWRLVPEGLDDPQVKQ
jgi:hypothetical protein